MKKRTWIRILAILLGVAALSFVAFLAYIPAMQMGEFVDRHVDFKTVYEASDFGLEALPLTLATEDGMKLAAWQVDAKAPRAAIVLVSGIHNPSVTALFPHAAMFQAHGYSSVLVEMRAHGQSEGDLISLGMKEHLDIRAAVRHLKAQDPDLPVVAFGISMGGATAINAIGETPEIDAVIALSAYSSWPDAFADNMEAMDYPKLLCAMEKPFVWLYMGFKYGFDSLGIHPAAEIRKLNGRPALLMHSKEDSQVPYPSFEKLLRAAPQAETYVVEGDRHFICEDYFLEPERDEAYAQALLGFLDAHFPAPTARERGEKPAIPPEIAALFQAPR